MKTRSMTVLSAVLLTAGLLLSGCGASKSSDTAASQRMQAPMMAETAAETAAMDAGVMNEYAAMEANPGDAPEAGSGYASLTSTASTSPLPASDRKLIRNVSMDVETDGFDTLVPALNKKITELGGYVEQSDISGSRLDFYNQEIPRHASITARIPSAKLDGFITEVETNGNVTNKSQSTSDVTLQYSDIESKKKSLIIEQDRLWALLEKAESMDAVVTLEERLSEIRYELESMESQLRLYDNQVDYSTVDLYIAEVKNFTPVKPESVGQRIANGFSKNVESVAQTATNCLISLLALSPVWIPALLILLIVCFLIRKKRRKSAARRAKTAVPESVSKEGGQEKEEKQGEDGK